MLKRLKLFVVIIYYDYASDHAITKNSVFQSRTKHIKLHHHFIRKLLYEGEIQLEFFNVNEQLADIFTNVHIQ